MATGLAMLLADKPAAGDQLYVYVPVPVAIAFSCTDVLLQMVVSFEMVTAGPVKNVTLTESVFLHLELPFVMVSLYLPVVFTDMVCAVDAVLHL